MSKIQPVLKWTGSKRYVSDEILNHIPREGSTYYEPFVGGASIGISLINSDSHKYDKYVFSDISEHNTGFLRSVRDDPEYLLKTYNSLWETLKNTDEPNKKVVYSGIRDSFNFGGEYCDKHDIGTFGFITRVCANGLIRFNKSGNFNVSLHHGRDGMNPSRYGSILTQWNESMSSVDLEILTTSYENHSPSSGDTVFCDPPYDGTVDIYSGSGFSVDNLINWVDGIDSTVLLTYNGASQVRSGRSYSGFDESVFNETHTLKTGSSSFKRLFVGSDDLDVNEKLFIKKK